MKLWIIAHHHRFGDSCWPVMSRGTPDLKKIAKQLEDSGDYEPDRDDEYLDCHGPYNREEIETV